MALKWLGGVQYGSEGATHGTAVAADTKLYCDFAAPERDREHRVPMADIGVRVRRFADNAVPQLVYGEGGSLRDTDGAYFELLPVLLNSCLDGGNTGSEQTSGMGDYLWTFDAPLSAAESLDTFTIEWGDGTQDYEMGYCLVPELSITFDATTGECHCNATVDGDAVIQTSRTSVTVNPAVEHINGSTWRLYVDSTWASAGTTEFPGSLVSGEVVIRGGAKHRHLGSANIKPDSHVQNEIDAEMRLTLERTTSVTGEELNYRPATLTTGPTMRAVRLECLGTAISSGTKSRVTIDMIGTWESWNTLSGDLDGDALDEVVLRLAHDHTSGAGDLTVDVITTTSAV